jgi:hypothetical protein
MPLPSSSFEGFPTIRLTNPRVAWFNKSTFSAEAARDAAFCIPINGEPESAYISGDSRLQLADRYGGIGVGYCGGSARCGIFGDVQIKGTGINPLYGIKQNASPDPWHIGGTMNLDEAGREVIWSAICDYALPHGAVSALAIVLTGTKTSKPYCTPKVPRVLLMRSPALRPAHFMRNIIFRSSEPPTDPYCFDSLRTSAAINMLANAFETFFSIEAGCNSATEIISAGLASVARRFAFQIAASFAKRIFHGGLCCSNIALDGRYLDFGTTTAVEAYRRRSGAPAPGGPDSWTQHHQLLISLINIRLHVARYLKCTKAVSLISSDELIDIFNKTHQERLEIEFLKLTGIPEMDVESYPIKSRKKVFGCFREIYSRGAEAPYVWRGDDDNSVSNIKPLTSTGKYNLNRILSISGQFAGDASLGTHVEQHLDDNSLLANFISCYNDLVKWHFRKISELQQPSAIRELAMHAKRLNSDTSFLDRLALEINLDSSIETNIDDFGGFIDKTIEDAREIFVDRPNDTQQKNFTAVEHT